MAGPAPRLLPAERIDETRLQDDAEDQAAGDAKDRRILRPGNPAVAQYANPPHSGS
ncbi:hypothetical protein OID55_42120 (plasmid) [Streptomyces sp. NBC_00715]|uniref:hypothetical protein n=1 Tax=Streptomyces sp. NBC_00715 TaxID=2975811 RepID=UPI002F9192DA